MDAKVKALIDLVPRLRDREVAVEPLSGGLTNRNFRLTSGRDRLVLRIAGQHSALLGIDHQIEHACAQAAFAAGIGPEVVAFFPRHHATVSRFLPGKVLGADDVRRPEILARVVQSLRRYHEGPVGVGSFSGFETVRRYYAESTRRGVPFPPGMASALENLGRIEAELGTPAQPHPCHNDLLPANFLHYRRAVWIVDWEYAGAGDRFFDLGNLAANGLFNQADEARLLRLYFGRARAADRRRLRLMRLASDMREAMWGFLQMRLSALDFDYQAYAHFHLRRFQDASRKQR